jgi:hypothetical protein
VTATSAALAHREAWRKAGERFMHDPNEEKKGGFGAFAQRDRERREAEELKNASPNGVTPPAPASAPSTPPGTTSPDASGTT